MSWLSTTERLAAINRSRVSFREARCLHARDKFSTCSACFEVCPVGAIRTEIPTAFDEKICANCMACLPACPVGAYSADDEVAAVLNCAARTDEKNIEILCGRHPGQAFGQPEAGLAIQIRGCLAGLGTGVYLALAALHKNHVIVRLDACTTCEWGVLQEKIHGQAAQAAYFLTNLACEQQVTSREEPVIDEGVERPVWDAHNPPLSRRDLFQLASRQGQLAAARAILYQQDNDKRSPGRDHQRIRAAIRHLVSERFEDFALDGMGFAALDVSDACTACKACVRSCPTGALHFEQQEENNLFRLLISPQDCVGCDLCMHVCAPGAIHVNHTPFFRDVFGPQALMPLIEGDLAKCARCKAVYAAQTGTNLCPMCEFRKKNTFGPYLTDSQRSGKLTGDT